MQLPPTQWYRAFQSALQHTCAKISIFDCLSRKTKAVGNKFFAYRLGQIVNFPCLFVFKCYAHYRLWMIIHIWGLCFTSIWPVILIALVSAAHRRFVSRDDQIGVSLETQKRPSSVRDMLVSGSEPVISTVNVTDL